VWITTAFLVILAIALANGGRHRLEGVARRDVGLAIDYCELGGLIAGHLSANCRYFRLGRAIGRQRLAFRRQLVAFLRDGRKRGNVLLIGGRFYSLGQICLPAVEICEFRFLTLERIRI
jgi:hypothetical protein